MAPKRRHFGAKSYSWHQKWCHFEYLLTYSQWEVTKLRVFFKNFFSHLFPVGEAIYQGVFEKTFKNSVAARKSGYCPFTYSMFESHFVTPSLIPSGKGSFLSSFQKNFRSLNPHLETVLSTYPARISPTIPYSNFCNWKTTRFLKKFSLNPIPQLSKPKNDIFSETFSKNVLTPLPHVFGQKTEALFQKSFLLLYRKFFRANLNTNPEKT